MNLTILRTITIINNVFSKLKNFIKDLVNLIKIIKLSSERKYCFFVETKFIYKYLKPYIEKKKFNEIVIVSFDTLKLGDKYKYFFFKTFFFQSLFFLLQKFTFFITSTPDLDNNYYYKKSKYNKSKYIYIQHSPLSLTKIYKENAFINFDVVQAINKFQVKELKHINKIFKKKIKIFKNPYLFLDNIEKKINYTSKCILVAPTWATDFYKLGLHKKIFKILKDNNINFTFRPHPMSLKVKEISIIEIQQLNIDYDDSPEINFKNYSDLISDWSGIFIEFALINKKFPILINNEQKNRNIKKNFYSEEPIEIIARKEIAHIVDKDQLYKIIDILNDKKITSINENKIIEFKKKYFF